MNQKEKGMFDRFLLALGSVALVPPLTAMPIAHRNSILGAHQPRLGAGESGPEFDAAGTRARWAT